MSCASDDCAKAVEPPGLAASGSASDYRQISYDYPFNADLALAHIQQQSVQSIAQLADVPLLRAVNR
ncbi:hypothetical protein GNZ12_19405 [Paraburkholderia sp. 1N]|uniref:Uncharacterized protein n=1 Tax=Paraburkholderia solitsugae TaxID=2675748 RepID=A0ABX2BTV2_9BURK|nr:hypothetical protein [Paraburkholderia solitsugae]NPT43435.1 hypothetical protein [Paraburkholderia solitsugae]